MKYLTKKERWKIIGHLVVLLILNMGASGLLQLVNRRITNPSIVIIITTFFLLIPLIVYIIYLAVASIYMVNSQFLDFKEGWKKELKIKVIKGE